MNRLDFQFHELVKLKFHFELRINCDLTPFKLWDIFKGFIKGNFLKKDTKESFISQLKRVWKLLFPPFTFDNL